MRLDLPASVRDRAKQLAAARGLPVTAIEALLDGAVATFDTPVARGAQVGDEENEATAAAAAPAEARAMDLEIESLARLYESSLASPTRRRSGSHYTSPAVAARIADAALAPLFARGAEALRDDGPGALEVTVCDPSMGGAACLLAAARWLAARAVERGEAPDARAALKRIGANLHGVDIDPGAAAVARISIWLEVGDPGASIAETTSRLRVGDGLAWDDAPAFDVMLGNPPWVSFVGRAAQPLDEAVRARWTEAFAAFAGYRNLQGLFLERAASLLREGGRMAFLVPSSMSEQVGYAPTRRAVSRYVVPDDEMLDVGEDAFAGVVQPCMIFAGTRRRGTPARDASGPADTWSVARTDLDATGRALLARLAALPTLPGALFGERGVQTSGADVADMAAAPDARRDLPLLSGTDIGAFRCGSPVLFADRTRFARRFREMRWSDVAFVVRQTAMFPIAAHARGHAFRNSLLAGLAATGDGAAWSADFIVGWLNASPIRWLHFHRFRDARQGLPQVKVGHLRNIPMPVVTAQVPAIAALSKELGARNTGVTGAEQRALDALVADALALGAEERRLVEAWARATPTPVSRRR